MLRSELTHALVARMMYFDEMKVRATFKGVTYESLSDPEFMLMASRKISSLDALHDEFDAAKADAQTHPH